MVTKLAKMKVKQDILVPIDKSKAFIFNGIDLAQRPDSVKSAEKLGV